MTFVGESYPSAEMQSQLFVTLVDWVIEHSLGEFYPSAEMQSVYLAAPPTGPIEIGGYTKKSD